MLAAQAWPPTRSSSPTTADPFVPWILNTTDTSASYVGQDGHTYGFYSVATDNVGNQEPFKTVADTTTTIDASRPPAPSASLPTFSPGTFTLSWSGSDPNGVGIASYSVYVSDNNGPFTPLLTGTTQTSTSFTGQDGHTYGFYSVATDSLGNQQLPPSSAQATTTVDAAPPTSSVASLPAFSPGSFLLSWSGSDTAGGSGLASYSIYVSDNGAPFAPLLLDTTQTSTTFTGIDGHTYGFYSVATDNVGNQQATPGAPQASTTVDTTPPVSHVAALPAFSPGSFTLSWSGSDGAGSGIASYNVYVSDNGSAFAPLLTGTGQTSTTFTTGKDGHTYGFYTVATDNVGNVGASPTSAQAATTVDATPPTSSVAALPSTEASPSFTVSWSGQDNPGGSGLASYSIYVSTDGGPFQPVLLGTTATSTVFTGSPGHGYGFYSVATDNVGNVQPTPSAAQASTEVVTAPSITITGASATWGSQTVALQTQSDGLRLLPSGRSTDLPWFNINQIAITLSQATTVSPGDVSVSGIAGGSYGPVTISGSGTTSIVITLAKPISNPDRVTLTISNSAIVTYTRRLDVLPGDVNDDGAVNTTDGVLILRNATPANAYNTNL